jgi:hypothetical protein
MFGNIMKQEIDATQSLISAPLGHFLDFRDFCSNIHLNYEFLTSAGHAIPELTRIDSFIHSIQPYTQFDAYVTTWTTANALCSRTLSSLTNFLLDQYGDIPTENAPHGHNAFFVEKGKGKYGKGKGKNKGKPKGKRRGSKRSHGSVYLSFFVWFVFIEPPCQTCSHHVSNYTYFDARSQSRQTLSLLLVPRMKILSPR